MRNERQPGYYWVKQGGIDEWIIGHYNGIDWSFPYSNEFYLDHQLDEIGSRITPEMKYTEEDMFDFADICVHNERATSDEWNTWMDRHEAVIANMEWLKQKQRNNEM